MPPKEDKSKEKGLEGGKSLSLEDVNGAVERALSGRLESVEDSFKREMKELRRLLEEKSVDQGSNERRRFEKEEEDEESGRRRDKPIVVEEAVSNKRSENEMKVLYEIIELATIDQGMDLKKRLVDIALVARKRIFLLEMAEKFSWSLALTYCDMFKDDTRVDASHLDTAVRVNEIMIRTKSKGSIAKKKVEKKEERSSTFKRERDVSKDSCFACGGTGHWASQCPNRNGK
jgi:hypothetical protein